MTQESYPHEASNRYRGFSRRMGPVFGSLDVGTLPALEIGIMTLTANPRPEAFKTNNMVGWQHAGYYCVKADTMSAGAGNMTEAHETAARFVAMGSFYKSIEIYWVESMGNGWAPAEFAEVLIEKIK